MFIKKLQISNFRCFNHEFEPLEFNTPNGKQGSGLNILVGENGSGKTTVLEAIEYMSQSRLKSKSSISIKDFNNIKKKILIESETDSFEVDHVFGKDKKFKCHGIQFEAKVREKSTDDLTDIVVFDTKVIATEGKPLSYELRTDVTRPWGASRLPNFEIIFFEKNRNRHITHGMFPSKFDELTDDLNYQVVEQINKLDDKIESQSELKQKLVGVNDYAKGVLFDPLTDKFLSRVLESCKTFFDNKIELDMLDNLQPFTHAFFASGFEESKQQIPISKLGSGVEMIFSIIFLYHYFLTRGRDVTFLIDEPELHLHPTWQYKLIELLKDISKVTQVFISTHSPFIYKNCLKDELGILVFDKDKNNKISVNNIKKNDWGNFPWSPSWGEINYYAYHLPTTEFHNELYGYLQEKTKLNSIDDFDKLLINTFKVEDLFEYVDKRTGKLYKLTICTYIRHLIHHPENKENVMFTDDNLKKSIDILLNCLKSDS